MLFLGKLQRSNLDCMFSQLSGEVLVAFAILIAISGLKEDFSLMSSERVFLDTPKSSATSTLISASCMSSDAETQKQSLSHQISS